MLPLKKKLMALNQIYAIYEKFVYPLETACEKYCADCCTCNVTLTTLEAYQIAAHLKENGDEDLFHQLVASDDPLGFQPRITTNRLAELCMRGEATPMEESGTSRGRCRFLLENACRIYPARPFGCRCLFSIAKCGITGYAEVTPFVLTVNIVFMQVIEHLDQGGLYGNLGDLVKWLAVEENSHAYETDTLRPVEHGLPVNRPLPCLMIPEEHQREIQPIWVALQEIEAEKRSATLSRQG